jgi:hypothetical protein
LKKYLLVKIKWNIPLHNAWNSILTIRSFQVEIQVNLQVNGHFTIPKIWLGCTICLIRQCQTVWHQVNYYPLKFKTNYHNFSFSVFVIFISPNPIFCYVFYFVLFLHTQSQIKNRSSYWKQQCFSLFSTTKYEKQDPQGRVPFKICKTTRVREDTYRWCEKTRRNRAQKCHHNCV